VCWLGRSPRGPGFGGEPTGAGIVLSRLWGRASDVAWRAGRLPAEMILQIHDELVFEADERDADRAARTVKEIMEGVGDLRVPLGVEVKTGQHWGEI